MLAPTARVLSPELASCRDFSAIVPSLRDAGVTRILSLDPLEEPSLRLLETVAPRRIAPLSVHVYELGGALPRFSLNTTIIHDTPDHLDLEVNVDEPTHFVVREPFANGWHATVNGINRTIQRSADGHRMFALDQGHNRIVMAFEPEGLRLGMAITLISMAACLGLLLRPRGKGTPERASPPDRKAGPLERTM